MSQKLSTREKRLLVLCLGTLFLVGNLFALREFGMRHKRLKAELQQVQEEVTTNRILMSDADFWEKRGRWLDEKMPFTESSGRSQGQLLELLQTTALDNELTVSNQTLLEPVALDHANEVAVSLRVRGDQEKVLAWLLTLQAPERFQAVKSFDIELDARARETTPQAQCNLIVARWFNPNPPPKVEVASPLPQAVTQASEIQKAMEAKSTVSEAEDEPLDDDEPVNPLDLGSSMGGL